MSKRNTIRATILSTFALAMVCMLSSAADAQKGPQGTTGAPLKGVDVKLGRPPGGSPAARTTTDADGNFTFPVVPAGEYILTVELKKEKSKDGLINASDPAFRYCYVTVNIAAGEKVERGYDLTQNKAFDASVNPAKQSTSKTKFETFIVRSDGITPLNGTIVKSKSNITNN
ncbi:MAG: carboxypeptidase regulatory-like domain-containing protein [Pyrinomonadaceae bacterium]|nr:carboxypeptidase regulatory-like domain-containing protein [Pyrinomonadaceae bacterium]